MCVSEREREWVCDRENEIEKETERHREKMK